MKKYINLRVVISFALLVACTFSGFAKNVSPSRADHFAMLQSKAPMAEGWVPDLTGLPDKDRVDLLRKKLLRLMSEDKDTRCSRIDPHLRRMVFQHFLIYQYMVNGQGIYFDERIARKWAHVFAMILKESSGDSTNITDMGGHSVSAYSPHTSLQRWKNLFGNAVQSRIKLNYQTNFGLTQLSADRLFVALNLAKNPGINTELFEGKKSHSTLKRELNTLNTAVAVRRLIWFYQGYAQGRIPQPGKGIHQKEKAVPKISKKDREALKMALTYCGTHFLFHQKDSVDEKQELSGLENAMASIADCKFGNPEKGYGRDKFDEKCFAQWVTICPALNIDIALLTPLAYFTTRKATPVCEGMFKRMINKKPGRK